MKSEVQSHACIVGLRELKLVLEDPIQLKSNLNYNKTFRDLSNCSW